MTFEARIVEYFSRRVLVDAADEDEAEEILNDLCAEGVIEFDCDDFNNRDIEVIGLARESSKSYLEEYNRNGKM